MAQDFSYIKNIDTRAFEDNYNIDITKYFGFNWNTVHYTALNGNPYFYKGQTVYQVTDGYYTSLLNNIDNADSGGGKLVSLTGYNKLIHGDVTYSSWNNSHTLSRILVTTSNGYVLGAGENAGGWLNRGNTTDIRDRLVVIYDPNDYSGDKCIKARLNGTAISGGAGVTTLYVLTENGKIFACGDNANGKLGIGTTTDSTTLVQSQDTSGLATGFVDFETSTGSATTTAIAVKSNGTWWSVGDGTTEITGNGNSTVDKLVWTQISELPTKAYKKFLISSSDTKANCLILYQDGDLYGAGDNASGILGNGNITSVFTYQLVRTGVSNFFISCIEEETTPTVWTIESGNIFTCGEGGRNQCLSNSTTDRTSYAQETAIPSGFTVTENDIWGSTTCTANYEGAFFFRAYNPTTGEYRLYAVGYNAFYQFGNNTTTSTSTSLADITPYLPISPKEIHFMDWSGGSTTVYGGVSWLVTKKGELFATGDIWGHNNLTSASIAYNPAFNHFPFCSNGEQDRQQVWERVWLTQASAGDNA